MAQIRETFDDDPVRKPGEHLVMWTIYDHPSDWPDWYVARPYTIGDGPEPVPGDTVILERDLERLRDQMQRRGLVKLMRNEGDHPNVVETWL